MQGYGETWQQQSETPLGKESHDWLIQLCRLRVHQVAVYDK